MRIRERRKQLHYSQEELAALVGIDQKQVSRYENGVNDPTADVLANLARALNTTTDWLVGLTDYPDRPLRGEFDLNDNEREAVNILRTKRPDEQRRALDILRML